MSDDVQEESVAVFMAAFVHNDENYLVTVAIPDDMAKEGAAFNSDAYYKGCIVEIFNMRTEDSFELEENDEVHIGLYKYNNRQYAMFYVKVKFVGRVTLEMAGEAQYMTFDQAYNQAIGQLKTGWFNQ